jgi:hypothetical protein
MIFLFDRVWVEFLGDIHLIIDIFAIGLQVYQFLFCKINKNGMYLFDSGTAVESLADWNLDSE